MYIELMVGARYLYFEHNQHSSKCVSNMDNGDENSNIRIKMSGPLNHLGWKPM